MQWPKSFLEAGNEVIICGRREERLLEAQKKHPELQIKVCNIADEEDRRTLLEWISAHFSNSEHPGLTMLVCKGILIHQRDLRISSRRK